MRPEISAATQLAAVIGYPVRHSLSPAIHNAGFAALGLDWAYTAFEVAPEDGEAAVAAATTLGIRGLSVTMPHKDAAARAVDELDPTAALLGAVNCVVNNESHLVGYNTDGQGFVNSLRIDHQIDPAGMSCLVVGAGGAARAVILALADASASQVAVLNRTQPNAVAAARLIGSKGAVIDPAQSASAIRSADLVVNATSIGMNLGDPTLAKYPFDVDLIGPDQVIADLIVHPIDTALLQAASERGATAVPGIGMLVHQAALAFTLWTNEAAPLEAMWQAVNQA